MKKYILLIAYFVIAGSLYAQRSYTKLTYNISLPMGDIKDYIDASSFRGAAFEMGGMFSPELSAGISVGWHTFYEETPRITQEVDGLTFTAKQYRYINSYPLMANMVYRFSPDNSICPFGALQVGTYLIERRTDLGLYTATNKNWHFGIAPEAGIEIELDYDFKFNISAAYQLAFPSGDQENTQSYLAFKLGGIWYY